MALTPEEQAELELLEREINNQINAQRFESGISLMEQAQEEQKRLAPGLALARSVRPTLAGLGATLGGLSATTTGPLGPATVPAAGALGFAGGERLGRAFEQRIGLSQPETLPESIRSTVGDITTGLAGEAFGPVVGAAGRGLARGGRSMGRFFQATTGVPKEQFRRLANQPEAFFTRQTVAGAGKKLGQAEGRAGIPQINTSDDVVQAFTGDELFGSSVKVKAQKAASELFDKIKAGENIGADEIVKGIRGVDDLIRKTPQLDVQQKRLLSLARTKFIDELSALNPALQETRKGFATAKLASNFRQALPVTETGKISPGRALFSGGLLAGGGMAMGLPGLSAASLTSPFVTGLLTSGAGGLMKLGRPLGIPGIRRAVIGSGTSALRRLFEERNK
jgi:hypothetical protein